MPDWMSNALEYVLDFSNVLNASISASWLILVVIALRLVMKQAPKWVNVALWGIVALRLLMPFSIESAFSLIPSAQTVSEQLMQAEAVAGQQSAYLDIVANPAYGGSVSVELDTTISAFQWELVDVTFLWLAGMAVMVFYTAVTYWRLRRRVDTAVILRDNIFQSEGVASPFVLGILRPRIYLPFQIDEQDLAHVIAHEQAHIRRKDHWWKPLGFLLLTIHWFNPLMWAAFILLCRDIELACDEKVIGELENDQRADYTQALVACSVNRRTIAACPLAFGEVGVKERVKSIMNYRKPAFWIIVTAVALCLVVAVCFLTDPKPAPEFAMTGGNVSDLDPEGIVGQIVRFQDIENSNVYMNANSFGLTVDADFDWVDSQAINYFFYEDHETRSAQLRIFPHENEYYLTEASEWPDQNRIFLLQHYLDAIRYLPQEAIRELAPADRYLIEHIDGGSPADFDRVITYSSSGVGETNGWYIHLRILPHHEAGDGYHGTGEEVVHLFYGSSSDQSERLDWNPNPEHTVEGEELIILRARLLEIHDAYYLVDPLDGNWKPGGVQVPMKNMVSSPEPQVGDILEIAYWGIPHDTHSVWIPNVHRISVAEQGSAVTMIPTDTSLKGLCAGALLLPMDGYTYRYLLSDSDPKGVTVDELLYTFREDDMGESIQNEVYSLREYPDRSAVLLISAKNGPWLCEYSPPQRCSDTARSDAINAGYVVMEDGFSAHGQEIWKTFYDRTRQGQEAEVTVAHYSTLDRTTCDSVYYQVFQQDYPCLHTYHLRFDRTTYTLTFQSGAELHKRNYAYLMRYESDVIRYVLTHDNTVTWEQLFHGMVSSQAGAYIDHYSIYTERKS